MPPLLPLRATYEPLLDGLAGYLLLTIPRWLPIDGAVDHWEGGHRGLIAGRLIDELGDRTSRMVGREVGVGAPGNRLWRRVKRRFQEHDRS